MASINDTVVANWKADVFAVHLEGYAPYDVFSANESGTFYKLKPGKTICVPKDACHGEMSKECASVLLCCNMDGSEEVRLGVIGKSKRTLGMCNMHIPVGWDSKSAWMMDIFNTWLLDFNSKMQKQKWNVLLFLDNCSSHMHLPQLHATKVVYFPLGTTSKAPPIDQGIVHSVKNNRKLLQESWLSSR